MGYIHSIQLNDNSIYLIEPILYAAASGTTTALTADINNFELVTGTNVNIKVGTVEANATLNVSNTGAKEIYYNNEKITANQLKPNHTYTFVYDGTYWQVVGDFDTDTTYSAMSINEARTGTATNERLIRADYLKTFLSTLGGSGLDFVHTSEKIELNHSNSVTAKTSYVDTATTASANGGKIKITDIKYDTEGHITGSQDRIITLSQKIDFDDTYLKLDGSNNMTADVNIITGDTNKFINFWYNTNKTAGASWRAGMLGSGSGNTNYFVIQSGTSTTSATTWHNALKIGQNNYDIYNNENRIPNTGNATGSVGGTTTPVYVDAGVIKAGTALQDLAYIAKPTSNTTTTFLRGDGTWQTALTAHQSLKAYAKIASPTFTGTPKAPTAADGTNDTQIATTEFVYNTLKVADAMIFKGTLSGATSTTYTPAADRGHTYKVANAGLINGERVEVGDILICTNDNTAEATSGNVSTVKSNWVIIQTNLDGAVIGPASSTTGHFALFDGNTGKLLKNSSYSPEDFSRSDHTHTLTIAEDTGTNNITLGYGKKYKLTAGGSTYIFTMPASDNTNTHRPIKVNDTQILGDNTTALNLKAGDNVTITATANSGDITIEAVDTTYESKAAASGGTAVSLVTTGEKYTWNQKLSSHGPSYGKVTVSAQSTATSSLTGLSAAVTTAAKEANETLKLTTANKWIIATGVSSNTAGADEIKLAHFVPASITNSGPASNQTPGYDATFDIPKISLDEAGHVTGISAITVKIPASDNTNTATAADNILKASNIDTEITYAPYTTRQPELTFDTATARPTGTDRLNLNGNFHATNLYGDTTVINEQVTLQWNNLDQALEFVFA